MNAHLSMALLSAAVIVFYGVVDPRLAAVDRLLVVRSRGVAGYTHRDLQALARLATAGIGQLLFGVILIIATGIPLVTILPGDASLRLMLYGAALGLGEAAVASFLCRLAMELATGLALPGAPTALDGWLTVARGGWMQTYLRAFHRRSAVYGTLLVILYVGVEEIVFRGIVLTSLLAVGKVFAIAVSTALFVVVQVFQMPGRWSAMFPAIGAALLGGLHGWLFATVPDIGPLILAHVVFFSAGALGFGANR